MATLNHNVHRARLRAMVRMAPKAHSFASIKGLFDPLDRIPNYFGNRF